MELSMFSMNLSFVGNRNLYVKIFQYFFDLPSPSLSFPNNRNGEEPTTLHVCALAGLGEGKAPEEFLCTCLGSLGS